MAYDKDTPADINEAFSVSQPKIKENFTSIKTAFDQDHETFDSGKHKQLTMPEQAAASSTAVNEMALYVLENATTNVSNLYLRLENNGTQFDLTPSVLGHATSGYEVLPSGLILKWGTGSVNANASATVAFNSGVAYSAPPYSVVVSRQGQTTDSGAMYYQSYNALGVTVYNASNNGPKAFTYYAIGK